MPNPNPSIAEEFWGIGMSQQGLDAQETAFEGMRVQSRREWAAGGEIRLGDAKDEGTPG